MVKKAEPKKAKPNQATCPHKKWGAVYKGTSGLNFKACERCGKVKVA